MRKFWEGQVESRLHTCFKIFAEFEAHVGEPRLFAWMDNVVPLPATDPADLKSVHFHHTGIAAAAKTDGRALTAVALSQLEGRLVIAVDENGGRYLKRFRPHGTLIVLESLNPDGTTPAELLSFGGEQGLPKLTALMEVVGILFELPS